MIILSKIKINVSDIDIFYKLIKIKNYFYCNAIWPTMKINFAYKLGSNSILSAFSEESTKKYTLNIIRIKRFTFKLRTYLE